MPVSVFSRRKYGYIRVSLLSLAAMAAFLPGPVQAQNSNIHCTAPMRSDWISWLEVEKRIKGQGMRLVRLRINDEKCLNVLAIDGHGQYMALLMHPVSGEILGQRAQADPNAVRTVPWKIRKEP